MEADTERVTLRLRRPVEGMAALIELERAIRGVLIDPTKATRPEEEDYVRLFRALAAALVDSEGMSVAEACVVVVDALPRGLLQEEKRAARILRAAGEER